MLSSALGGGRGGILELSSAQERPSVGCTSIFGFLYINGEIVVFAPLRQLVHVVVSDEDHLCGVTCTPGEQRWVTVG